MYLSVVMVVGAAVGGVYQVYWAEHSVPCFPYSEASVMALKILVYFSSKGMKLNLQQKKKGLGFKFHVCIILKNTSLSPTEKRYAP